MIAETVVALNLATGNPDVLPGNDLVQKNKVAINLSIIQKQIAYTSSSKKIVKYTIKASDIKEKIRRLLDIKPKKRG